MELARIEAKLLHSAIIHACYCLSLQRDALNAINLFPVADGDTGNNMAATAKAIINYSRAELGLNATLKSIADAATLGARGNSGMIFSQFFNGLSEEELNTDDLTTSHFTNLISKACSSVRQAILAPVEGTILSLMEAWSRSLVELAPTTACFNQLLQKAAPGVEKALSATKNTLPILKKADVVDAGALGFSIFIKAFSQFLAKPEPILESFEQTNSDEPLHEHEMGCADKPPTERYCTEAVLIGEGLDKESLSKTLETLGDSIVLSANQRICHFHLHCNEPWRLFQSLQTFGKIQYPKIDDMLRQYELLQGDKQRIALVTDTSANLPQALFDHHQVHLIALNLHLDGHDLLDKYSLDPDSFYEQLALSKTYPSTSFPPPAFMEDRLKLLSQHYEQVLVISMAQILSGTHDAFVKAAQSYDNVHVINSRQVSGGQGLLVKHAAELIAAGNSIEEIKESLAIKIAKTRFLVMVDQFDSLIRSGRVSKLQAKFAQFTGIKPIICLDKDGRGEVYDKAFGETKALAKLVHHLTKLSQPSGLDSYCIVHAGVKEKAEEFALMTTEALGQGPAFIEAASTAIGLHAGKGCIALAGILK